jgi:SAM-dependent methyltransferase
MRLIVEKIMNRLSFFNSGMKEPARKKLALDYINSVRKNSKVTFYQPTYNPNNFKLYEADKSARKETNIRAETISNHFDFSRIGSYLDIGSGVGYFVFVLAESKKIIAQGIEMDKILCAYSNAIVILNELENVSFTNCKLTTETAEKLPRFDLISFLNVFHHIVHFDGFDAADKIMRILFNKCNYFVFETGQYNEKGYYWTEDLKFMGDDPDLWVKEYIVSLGYKILHDESFKSALSDNTRTFICCSRV